MAWKSDYRNLIVFLSFFIYVKSVMGVDPNVHDPFLINAEGRFYLLSTGTGISIHESKNMLEWDNVDNSKIFQKTPKWASDIVSRRPKLQANMPELWSPSVYYFNNKYHLYSCTGIFGTNDMAIGLATSPTMNPNSPEYKWTDQGFVLRSRPRIDDFSAMTSHVITDEKGGRWLLYGGNFGGVKLGRLDEFTGKIKLGGGVSSIAARPRANKFEVGPVVEGPFLYKNKGFWYLFVSFDNCCKGVDSTYNIRVGRYKGHIWTAQGKI